jgi:hypothetical protein
MIIPDISVEELLLLRLCRISFSGEQEEEIRELIDSATDWKYFTFLAAEHGIAALIYSNLAGKDLLPKIDKDAVNALKESLIKSMTRNAFHAEILYDVVRLLNSRTIKTILLKGMALELSEYGNSGLRQMTDIDILISREDCLRARNILEKNGFISSPVKSPLHNLIIFNTGKHLPAMYRNGAAVEIHYELFGADKTGLTSVLSAGAAEIKIKDQTAYIPDLQLFFLYLIRHLWIHEINNESQLRLYTDLAVLLENHYGQIVTPDLLSYAAESEMPEVLAAKLEIMRDAWGFTFPDPFNDFIKDWCDPRYINSFSFFLKNPKSKPLYTRSEYYLRMIKDIPGAHRKFIFVLGDLFPSLSFMKKRYKCKSGLKAFFFYPHRAGKVLWLITAILRSGR